MARITQHQRIKNLLESGGTITSWEAFGEFGITRLSAIIFNLRHKDGLDIVSKAETRKNRYGEKVTFERYSLKKDSK